MLLQQLVTKRKTKAVAKSGTSVLYFFFSSWITFQEFVHLNKKNAEEQVWADYSTFLHNCWVIPPNPVFSMFLS